MAYGSILVNIPIGMSRKIIDRLDLENNMMRLYMNPIKVTVTVAGQRFRWFQSNIHKLTCVVI